MSTGSPQRVQTISLVIIASVLSAAALHWLQPVMVPFVLAILLTYGLAPIVDGLVARCHFPRWAAVLAAVLLGFLVVSAVAALVTSSVRELNQNADMYQQRVSELLLRLMKWFESQGIPLGAETINEQLSKIPFGKMLGALSTSILNLLSNTFLVLVFAIYLLQGTSQTADTTSLRSEIEGRVKNYLFMKFVLSAGTGVLTSLILWSLGIKWAAVFGILAFILNFIPSVGSVVAVVLPLPLVVLEPDVTGLTITLAIVLPSIVQVVIGNIIEPKWMGDSLQLHPITILLALVFWSMLWDVPGMLLATPICAAMRIVFDSFEGTKPLARLLAGQLSENEESEEPPSEADAPADPIEA